MLQEAMMDASHCIHRKAGKLITMNFNHYHKKRKPLVLRQEGNLEKECVIVGVGDHVEIWSQSAWDQFYDDNKDSFDDISEDLDEFEL